MRVLDITEIKLERLDLTNLHPHKWKPYEILSGHIGTTTILRYIANTLGTLNLHPEDVTDPSLMPWRMLMGMGWEAMGAQLYPNMIWQPRVLKRDGIMGHPDGYTMIESYKDEWMCIEEFKYTAKSLREKGAPKEQLKDIRREWMWQHQMMSYLAIARKTLPYYLMNPDAPLLGRFHIMWAMGCYEKYTLDERYLRYLVEYEVAEVERAWEMLENNKKEAERWARQ